MRVDAPAYQQEHQTEIHPHHRDHDHAYISVGAEEVRDRDVERKHSREGRPHQRGKYRSRPLMSHAVPAGRDSRIHDGEQQRQHREDRRISQLPGKGIEPVHERALRQPGVQQPQYLRPVDQQREADDDHYYKLLNKMQELAYKISLSYFENNRNKIAAFGFEIQFPRYIYFKVANLIQSFNLYNEVIEWYEDMQKRKTRKDI